MIPAIEQLCVYARTLAVLGVALGTFGTAIQSAIADGRPLHSPPRHSSSDEILLLNTRMVGTACDDISMSRRLQCEQCVATPHQAPQWKPRDWNDLVFDSAAARPTVIYIHGNRIARGEDRRQGLQVYRSLTRLGNLNEPIRFIIWSWPSSAIPGPVKDYKVKACRTRPAAWQLAWFLDQLPAESRVSLLGYSYGARVASGAMHVLGGGSLDGLKLHQRNHPQHKPFRVALIAAAFDANWIQPGHFHSRVMSQVKSLMIATNQLDPIMRFYHLSNGRGHVDALGKRGVAQPQTLGSAIRNIKMIDFTRAVGRSHALVNYLAVSGKMQSIWQELLATDASAHLSKLSFH